MGDSKPISVLIGEWLIAIKDSGSSVVVLDEDREKKIVYIEVPYS